LRLPLAAASAALLSFACATPAPPSAAPAAAAPNVPEVKPTGMPGQAVAVRTQLLAGAVQSVDAASRSVTVKWKDGQVQTLQAGPEVKRFDATAPGDEVLVDVQQELRLEVQLPGSPSVPFTVAAGAGRGTPTGAPGAVVAAGIQATVTVIRIDAVTRVVTLQDPAGATYEVRAHGDLRLEKLKVGDRLLATYTEATVVRLDQAPKQP
jgi:hypothetical protein